MSRRPILLSPDVIHKIWAVWKDGDEDEDAILRRVLVAQMGPQSRHEPAVNIMQETKTDVSNEEKAYETVEERGYSEEGQMGSRRNSPLLGKVRWVDDVRQALLNNGGEADLARIYIDVERLRRDFGRTTPKSLEATVRQAIEAHCPTSDNYREGNGKYFEHVARGRYRLIR